jgi:hypothetical protein
MADTTMGAGVALAIRGVMRLNVNTGAGRSTAEGTVVRSMVIAFSSGISSTTTTSAFTVSSFAELCFDRIVLAVELLVLRLEVGA